MEEISPLGPEFLFSALLAEIGRFGAAKCTWDEVAAHFGAIEDSDQQELAQDKLGALMQRQGDWLDTVMRHYSH